MVGKITASSGTQTRDCWINRPALHLLSYWVSKRNVHLSNLSTEIAKFLFKTKRTEYGD